MPSSMAGKVTLRASVAPSEDVQKLIAAVCNMVEGASFSVDADRRQVTVTCASPEGLSQLHDQLRDRRVRDAAKRRLLAGIDGRRTTVMVNRQAAAARVLSLCDNEDESPLGPVYLTIESDELEEIIGWLTGYSSG